MRGLGLLMGVLIALMLVPASANAVAFITYTSDNETDYVGQGQSVRATSEDANANPLFTNSRFGYFDLSFAGYLTIFKTARNSGQDLQLGTYIDNFGTGDADAGDASPSLDISNGRGCNSEQGVFTIKDLARDGAGTVVRIWVIFDQRCTESTAHLRGQVAYGYPPGTTPENIGQAVAAPADRARPSLGTLGLSRRVFRPARRGPSVSAKARMGTRVSFSLSEPGAVTAAVERRASGRKVSGRCVASKRSNRRNRRCLRWPAVNGSFSIPAKAGRNSFLFTGRMAGKALKPGRYRLVVQAKDGAGNLSKVRRKSFRVSR